MPDEEKRTERVLMSLTKRERRRLEIVAKQEGIALTELARRGCLLYVERFLLSLEQVAKDVREE